jgi:large subunit ribosomal protein L10
MAHVSQYKKDVVEKLVKLITESKIIGSVNLEDLPASALQKMRSKLRGKAEIFMTKRRLMKVAFEQAEGKKKGVVALLEHLKGMPALLFTQENPFAIYKIIKQSKSPAAAKAGQTAPKDIEVKAGPTPFLPGPIIGELGSLGIKSGVENGKVAIKEDKIVVKEGEVINANAAGILSRLGIEPMELGLDITAVFEDGVIYGRKVLDIDQESFMSDFTKAAGCARNLAMEIAYPAKEIVTELIAKAHLESKALGKEAAILVSGVINDLLAKAQAQAGGLKQTAKIE